MTYNTNVPNSAQSPGLFPTQCNTNFNRLQQIITTDHVFNATRIANTDGIHKQVTMVVRTAPTGALPSGQSAILYSKVDAFSQCQLWYYNGVVDVDLTSPTPQEIGPIRVVGTQVVASNAFFTVYADPGFPWAGTGHVMITNTTTFGFWNLLRTGGNDTNEIDDSGGSVRPLFSFTGNSLQMQNKSSTSQSLTWSLIINRISNP